MQKNIIITGKPKSGKSTLLRELISEIPNKVGFVTNEILKENTRVGFEMENHEGHKETLAHVSFNTPYKVSKYFVDIENLDILIPEISDFQDDEFLYLDEIGQMQLFSDKFKELTLQYLSSQNTCLFTLSHIYEDDFTKEIKERDDIILVEISEEDREEKKQFLIQLLKKIKKAKAYFSESERFTIKEDAVELRSEHDTRKLVLKSDGWNCDCDFFGQYEICSHSIATKEFLQKS